MARRSYRIVIRNRITITITLRRRACLEQRENGNGVFILQLHFSGTQVSTQNSQDTRGGVGGRAARGYIERRISFRAPSLSCLAIVPVSTREETYTTYT